MSLDIARGLNFLSTIEIVHRDIRAENILITLHETAKLANFKLSRLLSAATLKQGQNLERVRYCAPELLERAPNFKYDHKCEVYSFGILLWEIAEEKTPYNDYKDIIKITDIVRNRYRESFSENSQMSEEFRNLALNAVNHDPVLRPNITKMFEILSNGLETFEKLSHTALNYENLKIDNNKLRNDSSSYTGYNVTKTNPSNDYKKIREHSSSLPNVNVPNEEIGEIAVPFSKFLPIISEVANTFNEVIDTAQTAKHNKRICNSLQQRVYAAVLAVLDLKVHRDKQEYFTELNYLCLQNL
ncbi:kinase-like domain-containing protein, partial [Glomus cerebriforme]